MSHRNVQLLIGRLVTDEDLRHRFLREPRAILQELCDRGLELTRGEIEALVEADTHVWTWMAGRLPSRLQRCSLKVEGDPPGSAA